jgi:hypothetical protein
MSTAAMLLDPAVGDQALDRGPESKSRPMGTDGSFEKKRVAAEAAGISAARSAAPALAGLEHECRAGQCGESKEGAERLGLEQLHEWTSSTTPVA